MLQKLGTRRLKWSDGHFLLVTQWPFLPLPICWFFSLPSSHAWKGNTSLVSVIHFRALPSWEEADRVPSHSGAPQGGQVPSNPHCGTPTGPCHWPTTMPVIPGQGSGSDASTVTKLHCPLCVPRTCAPGSCPEALLSFGAFFWCIGSYSLSTGYHAWLDLAFESWTPAKIPMCLLYDTDLFADSLSSPPKWGWESNSLLGQNRSNAEQRWALEAEQYVWGAWEQVCPTACCSSLSSFTKIAAVGKGLHRRQRIVQGVSSQHPSFPYKPCPSPVFERIVLQVQYHHL